MINIQRIHKELAWQVRHEVMWPDKEFDYIKLADDDQGIHYGLYANAVLVSVVSLFIQGSDAQFRKFATKTEFQSMGYGTQLLSYVLKEAERAGVKRVFCNARSSKTAFYEKFGLKRTDHTFTKGGKDYVVMEKHI